MMSVVTIEIWSLIQFPDLVSGSSDHWPMTEVETRPPEGGICSAITGTHRKQFPNLLCGKATMLEKGEHLDFLRNVRWEGTLIWDISEYLWLVTAYEGSRGRSEQVDCTWCPMSSSLPCGYYLSPWIYNWERTIQHLVKPLHWPVRKGLWQCYKDRTHP